MIARSPAGAFHRALGALLLLLMVVGAFVLWVGVPAGVLWALGKVANNRTEHLLLGLLAVPLGMVLFGFLLTTLNSAYLRVSRPDRGSGDEERKWAPRLRGPLDRIIGISAIAALIALLIWMIFGDTQTGSVPPW